uniref:Uncharacterized protein n=1 Tax=Rhizophora mucronata TaxID=61149 RepID=A0A2P2NQS0_RHIMU
MYTDQVNPNLHKEFLSYTKPM